MGEQWRERTEHRELFFEQAAWDLAIATQELVYVDADLAFKRSRAYTLQREYVQLQRTIVQSTISGQSWTQDIESVLRSILNYLGDVSYFDPVMLRPTTRCSSKSIEHLANPRPEIYANQ